MNCPYCGRKDIGEARFFPGCGSVLPAVAPQPVLQPGTVPSPSQPAAFPPVYMPTAMVQPQSVQKTASKRLSIGGLSIAALAVAVLAVAAAVLTTLRYVSSPYMIAYLLHAVLLAAFAGLFFVGWFGRKWPLLLPVIFLALWDLMTESGLYKILYGRGAWEILLLPMVHITLLCVLAALFTSLLLSGKRGAFLGALMCVTARLTLCVSAVDDVWRVSFATTYSKQLSSWSPQHALLPLLPSLLFYLALLLVLSLRPRPSVGDAHG